MDPLKKTEKESQKSTYVDALFATTPWFYDAPKDDSLPHKNEPESEIKTLSPEKSQLLHSLKDFAHKEAKENKLQFEGGEIRLKPALKECDSVEELQSVWMTVVNQINQDYALVSAPVHELKTKPIKVLFVGDFPKAENQVFVGEVRDLLLKMISAMKLTEKDFALSSVVKHHKIPEGKVKELGRDSLSLLHYEVLYYKPQMLISLGALASSLLLGTEERLSSIHGEIFERELMSDKGTAHAYQIMPIFHPEFLLINPNMKKTTWTDLQKAMKSLGLS